VARWEGENEHEVGRDAATGIVRVRVDPQYYRPAEVEQLLGDPAKAKRVLGWNNAATPFTTLVREMVDSDIAHIKSGNHRD
jgi:GDPmannose 4,6-dehydratase